MKRIIILATFILSSVIISCSSGPSGNAETNPEEHDHAEQAGMVYLNEKQIEALGLKTGSFQMRNLTTVVKLSGQLTVAPSGNADVSVVMGGYVTDIKTFFGEKVRKGEVLALLEHPDYITLQEEFVKVANNLEYLQQEYERQKQLFEHNIGAGKDYQLAKTNFNTAKIRFKGLKTRLEMLNLSSEEVLHGKVTGTITVTSPIDGYVTQVFIKSGAYADAENPLFEVTDTNKLHADFLVYEKDVFKVKSGQKIHFTVANNTQKEYSATVYATGKEFNPKTRAIRIHTKIDGDQSGLLPGMYISGHLHTDKTLVNTLPEDAIVDEGGKSYIFVELPETDQHDHGKESDVKDDYALRAFKMIEVVTGKKDEGYVEVKPLEAIPENTEIVLNAAYYLLADMKKEETEHEH